MEINVQRFTTIIYDKRNREFQLLAENILARSVVVSQGYLVSYNSLGGLINRVQS